MSDRFHEPGGKFDGVLYGYATENIVSMMFRQNGGSISVASADLMHTIGDDEPCEVLRLPHWWVSRVVVKPFTARRIGIGSFIVQRMLAEIAKTDIKVAVVVPGGYDMEEEDQSRFYKKQGFVELDDFPGVLVWRAV